MALVSYIYLQMSLDPPSMHGQTSSTYFFPLQSCKYWNWHGDPDLDKIVSLVNVIYTIVSLITTLNYENYFAVLCV